MQLPVIVSCRARLPTSVAQTMRSERKKRKKERRRRSVVVMHQLCYKGLTDPIKKLASSCLLVIHTHTHSQGRREALYIYILLLFVVCCFKMSTQKKKKETAPIFTAQSFRLVSILLCGSPTHGKDMVMSCTPPKCGFLFLFFSGYSRSSFYILY